jgi:hypothetical protein
MLEICGFNVWLENAQGLLAEVELCLQEMHKMRNCGQQTRKKLSYNILDYAMILLFPGYDNTIFTDEACVLLDLSLS